MRKNFFILLIILIIQLNHFSVNAQTITVEIGNGTSYNSTTAHPTPYGTYYKNHRVQYLYLASELAAAGLAAGDITEIAFNVQSVNSCSPMPNFTIKAKLTTANTLTTTFDNSGFTTVFTASSYTPVVGWNTHVLSTPITWDGTSNLLIDICFDMVSNFTQNASVYYTTTTSNLAAYYRSDTSPACGTTNSATTSTSRANIKLTGQQASCMPVSNITVYDFTPTSVTISWASTNSVFEIEYGQQGFTIGNGTRVTNINDTFYQLTGLTPATNYQAYVRAICGVGDTSNWASVSFTTLCSELTDFTENFDALTTPALPSCWYKVGTTGSASTQSTNYFSAPNCLYLYGSSSTSPAIVSLPPLNNAGDNTHRLRFKMRANYTAGGVVQLGYLTNPQNPSTFVPIQSVTASSLTYQEYTIYPGTAPGANKVLALKHTGDPAYSVLIDDVIWEQNPTCTEPLSLSITNLTGTTVTINWISQASEFEIEYGAQGFTIGTGTRINNITDTIYQITGLLPVTNYQVYVRAICGPGDTSYWSTITFQTPCAEISSFPWLEDFSGSTFPPDCWNRAKGQLSANTTFTSTTTSSWIADGFANNGTAGATSINIYGTNKFEWLMTPQIDLGNGSTNYKLEFDLALTAYASTSPPNPSGTDDKFAVVISTDGGTTWSSNNLLRIWDNQGSAYVYNNISNTGEHVSIDLTGYTGIVRIGFYGESTVSNADNDLFIDNVTVKRLANCAEPYGLTATNITQNSADLSWSVNNTVDYFEVQYGQAGFTLGYGTIVTTTSTNYTLTGLNAATSYSYYVRSICVGIDSSEWIGPFNFTTQCGPVTAIYTQNFDGVTTPNLPNCWSSITLASSGSPTVTTVSTGAASNPNCVKLFNDLAVGSSTHVLLITPQFSDLPTHNTQITFKAKFQGTGTPVLYVGTMLDPSNPGTFQNYQTITSLTTDWQEYTVAFNNYTGSNQYIAFKHGLGTTNQSIFIDDVIYEPIPTCPKPINLQASNVQATDVMLAWTPVGTETEWEIEYGPAGFSHGNGNIINVNTSNYQLTGLNPSTTYDVYVRAVCSVNDVSTWLGPVTFTTTQIPATLPYTWDFENDFNGWTVVNGTQVNKWFTGTATFASPTKSAYISNTNGTSNNYDGTSTSVTHIYRDVQFSNANEFIMTFKWKGVGESTYDYMRIFLENTTFEPVAGTLPTQNQIGKQYYNQNNTWKTDTILFDNTVANTVKRLIFTWRNDGSVTNQPPIAIDDIEIKVVTCPRPINLTASNITSSSATLSWTEQGSAAQWQILYGVQGFSLSTGTLLTVNNDSYNLSGLSSGIFYSFYVRSICGPGDTSFWAGPYTFYVPCDALTATYTENFDNVTTPNLPVCWLKKVIASSSSAYVKTSTSSPASSPNCVELYNYNSQGSNTYLLLISPRFSDLPSHTTRIRFKLKGNTTERLIVGTMSNPSDETTFTPFDTIIPTSTWTEKMVSFLNYTGNDEYIVFKHGTFSTYTYLYIDDFVYEPLPSTDIAVTEITQPSNACGLTSNESITIKVKNVGIASQSNIDVAYQINNNTPVIETITQTILPGDSLYYTFATTADFSVYGNYSIKAYVINSIDEDHTNDTTIKQVTSRPLISTFPYLEDFEANNGYWTAGGVNSSWQWGTPAGSVINSAASGTHAWVTNLSGNYNNNENSWVESPCFDFSSLTHPYISLKRIVHAENSYDGAAIQVSVDGGNVWYHIGNLNDPNNWYNDNTVNGLSFCGSQEGWTGTTNPTWVTSIHHVTPLAGYSNVKFRIVFGSDGSITYEGFAFDDFKIFEPSDLAIVYPVDSSTSYLCGLTNSEHPYVWIKNVGSTTIQTGTQIGVSYKLNQNNPVNETMVLTNDLVAGDSILYTFTQTVDLSNLTSYLFKYWITYSEDYNTSNDTVMNTIQHFVLTVNINGGDTICINPIFLPYTLTLQYNPVGYDSYFWSNQSGTLTGTNSMFDAPAFGWYYVTVTKGNCVATDSVFLCNILNVKPVSSTNILVYPSPAPNYVVVHATNLANDDYTVSLQTIDGKIIEKRIFKETNALNVRFETTSLSEGVYVITISNSKDNYHYRVVK